MNSIPLKRLVVAAVLAASTASADGPVARIAVVPYGDWAPLFRAFASRFVDVRTSSVQRLSVDLSYFPTSDTGLNAGDLWRDGDVIKVKE